MFKLTKQMGLGVMLGMTILAPVQAETVSAETGWLELVKGHLDKRSGTTVADVQPGEEEGTRKVTLYIPRETLDRHDGDIEEVTVVGQRPGDGVDIDMPEFRYEWVEDYDNDYYGLVIHLRDDGSLPLRLYLESRTAYTDQDSPHTP